MKKSDVDIERLGRRVQEMVEAEKARIRDEESFFHQNTGARRTLRLMVETGLVHPDFKSLIQEWLKRGGITGLEVNGRMIFPVP